MRCVHRTPDGHWVRCEGHHCPSTQCPLYSLGKDLTARVGDTSSEQFPNPQSLLWNAINMGHFQVRLFWLFLSLNQVALYLSGDSNPTPVPSQRPQRREEIRLSWAFYTCGVGRGITNWKLMMLGSSCGLEVQSTS